MLLDTTKAAAYLGAGIRQLAYWRSQGYGPAYVRRGRSIGYRSEALDAWREWCVAHCQKYQAPSFGAGLRWAKKLNRRPGNEHAVPEADLLPPLLDGKAIA